MAGASIAGTWDITGDGGGGFSFTFAQEGTGVSGLEYDGADLFYCSGGPTGKVRAVKRPRRTAR